MPDTFMHLISATTCVVAAGLLLALARGWHLRLAHTALFATMVVAGMAMHSLGALLLCVIVLLGTAGALAILSQRRGQALRGAAVDHAGCAGLLLVMAIPAVAAVNGDHAAPVTSAASHHAEHGHSSLLVLDNPILVVLTGLVIAGWWTVRWHSADATGSPRARTATPHRHLEAFAMWLMLAGMGMMILA